MSGVVRDAGRKSGLCGVGLSREQCVGCAQNLQPRTERRVRAELNFHETVRAVEGVGNGDRVGVARAEDDVEPALDDGDERAIAGTSLAVKDLRSPNQVAVGDGVVDAETQRVIAGADEQAVGIDELALVVDERRDGLGVCGRDGDGRQHQQPNDSNEG